MLCDNLCIKLYYKYDLININYVYKICILINDLAERDFIDTLMNYFIDIFIGISLY